MRRDGVAVQMAGVGTRAASAPHRADRARPMSVRQTLMPPRPARAVRSSGARSGSAEEPGAGPWERYEVIRRTGPPAKVEVSAQGVVELQLAAAGPARDERGVGQAFRGRVEDGCAGMVDPARSGRASRRRLPPFARRVPRAARACAWRAGSAMHRPRAALRPAQRHEVIRTHMSWRGEPRSSTGQRRQRALPRSGGVHVERQVDAADRPAGPLVVGGGEPARRLVVPVVQHA